MATIVFLHAHPDDESTSTAGTITKAVRAGHRVILVTATRGEYGECPDGLLADGEVLWQRRARELAEAVDVLSIARHAWLGYCDSGMIGAPENEAPESFWQADVEEAAERLARVLRDEAADALVVYDDHGLYGHPDHIQVHRVGIRAADLAGTPEVYEVTMDRDKLLSLMSQFADATGEEQPPDIDMATFGTPAADITTRVDVRSALGEKRRAMECHASQAGDIAPMLAMPDELYAAIFGEEYFVRRRPAAPGLIDALA